MLSNWFIGEDKNYYYGENEESIREENDLELDFEFISKEDWTAENYAEIFGNELEDRNRHSITGMPTSLLYILNKTSLNENEKSFIMKEFMNCTLNEI